MTSLYDGLGGEELAQSGLQAGGTNINPYFTGSVTSASVGTFGQLVTAGSIGATGPGTFGQVVTAGSVLSTGVVISNSKTLTPWGSGSPTTWGLLGQAGSAIASNVAVVVSFGTAFSGPPLVVMTEAISGAQATTAPVVLGPATAGSFVFLGTSGAPYNWVAIG